MKYKLKDTKGRTHKLRLIGDKWVSKTTIFEGNLTPYEGEMVHLVAPKLLKLVRLNFDMEAGPFVERKKGFYCLSTDEWLQRVSTDFLVPYTQKDWDEIADDPNTRNKDFIESLLLGQEVRNGDVL